MKHSFLFYLFVLLSLVTGCSSPALISSWQYNDVKIDGSREEWNGAFNFIEDENIALAMKNDDSFLYLCLATSDRSKMMKIMQLGLTVWLDPLNSDGKTIGIQYPVMRQRDSDPNLQMGVKPNKPREEQDTEKEFRSFTEKQNEILIVNENSFPLNALPTKNIDGIEVELGNEMQQFIYELRIPLVNNKVSPVFVDALPGEEIKISFETGEFKRPEKGDRNAMGERGAGSPMAGGGRRGGMRGGGQDRIGNVRDNTDPIDFSVDVKLSKK